MAAMMKWEKVQTLNDKAFRRLTGVKRRTFAKMIEIIAKAQKEKKARGGRPNSLTIEDMILATLEYLREYRTYFHISQSYGLSESSAYKTIRWVEDVLIKDKAFSLPGRKALLKTDNEFEIVLIDVTESPIERPKKTT
jgi:Helix-turn-helix of DDE superfamily endonuclease